MVKSQNTMKATAVAKKRSGDLDQRLGPVREVVKMARASDTKAAYRLTLKCGHVRVATKRKTFRCRRCLTQKAGK